MEYKSILFIIPAFRLAIAIFLFLIVQTISIAVQDQTRAKAFYLELQVLAHSLDRYFGTPTLPGLNYQNPEGRVILGFRNMSGNYSDGSSDSSSCLDFVGYSRSSNLMFSLKLGGENNCNYLGIGLIF